MYSPYNTTPLYKFQRTYYQCMRLVLAARMGLRCAHCCRTYAALDAAVFYWCQGLAVCITPRLEDGTATMYTVGVRRHPLALPPARL